MSKSNCSLNSGLAAFAIGLILMAPAAGLADNTNYLRVVTYNTANDVSGNTNTDYLPRTGMSDVLKAIGAENVGGISRPVDILALQESVYYTGNGINPTAQGFVNVLNTLYGTAANPTPYAAATINGSTDGNLTGNGPQTLVYNTTTVQLVSQAALGTPGGSGVARQVMEYGFQPVGYSSAYDFTVFNDHFKSGTSTSDQSRRGFEGTLVAQAANALGPNAAVIYAGDYNPTKNATDPGYVNVIAGTGSNNNHGIDPLNGDFTSLSSQTESPATTAAFSGQSTGGMRYRDDLLLNSPAAQSGSYVSMVPGSYLAFGNTGTHQNGGAITTGSASAFAAELPGYSTSQAATVLTELSQVADHLPVVADYEFAPSVVPEPSSIVLCLAGLAAAATPMIRRRVIRAKD